MRWLKMLCVLILCLIILFVGIMFTIHNTEKVTIDLLFIALPEASLSLWLIAFFVAGGILGISISAVALLSLKTKLSLSNKRVVATSNKLDALKASTSH